MFASTSRCLCMQYMYRFTLHIKSKMSHVLQGVCAFSVFVLTAAVFLLSVYLFDFFFFTEELLSFVSRACSHTSSHTFDANTQLVLSLTPRLL